MLGKKLIIGVLSLITVMAMLGIAEAKSVYVISDTGTWETDIPMTVSKNIILYV